jgi:hypothetical protein
MAHQTAGPLVTLRVGAQGLYAGQQVGAGLQLGLSVQPAMPGRQVHPRKPDRIRPGVDPPTVSPSTIGAQWRHGVL